MRTHAAWYLKGLPNSVVIKQKLYQITTKEEFYELFNEYKNK
jgi:tRNA-dihydrouridine synthase